jgi:hypothetical protein
MSDFAADDSPLDGDREKLAADERAGHELQKTGRHNAVPFFSSWGESEV